VVTVSSGQSALACLFLGVIAAGGIYSAASYSSTVDDLTRQIRDGPGKVLVCSADAQKVALQAAQKAGLDAKNVLILESYPQIKLYSAGDPSISCDFKGTLRWKKITDPKELEKSKVCLLYSSGTTGLPKGTQRNRLPWFLAVC
jgi:4-coumarate--CoA ligase